MAHIRPQFLHNLYKLVDLCLVGFSFFLAVSALSYQCSARVLAYHVRFSRPVLAQPPFRGVERGREYCHGDMSRHHDGVSVAYAH